MVLENKLGITYSAELARMEEKISKKQALALFETGLLDTFPVGSFAGLGMIHRYLFHEIYEFAGQVRDVNIAKGSFRFAPLIYFNGHPAPFSSVILTVTPLFVILRATARRIL